jgi:hypothetical protein
MNFFNEAEVTADLTTSEPILTEVKSRYRKRTRLTTDKLPQELPKGESICPDFGGELHTI